MSLLTNSTNSEITKLITDTELLEENCSYKIRMDNILLKNGNLFRYVGKKVLSNKSINNIHGLNGMFFHFIWNGDVDEYFGETWISLYTFEKVINDQVKFDSENEFNYSYEST